MRELGAYVLDIGGAAIEIDDALVDFHDEVVPGVGTLSTGGLAGGDGELLGGNADGPACLEVLLLGFSDEVGARRLQGCDEARLKCNPEIKWSYRTLSISSRGPSSPLSFSFSVMGWAVVDSIL